MDIAVDPLEGTNLCATGAPNAITVLAASEKGGLLHAPDLYMEKIVVGPTCKGAVDLDAPVADNIRAIARRLNRDKEDLSSWFWIAPATKSSSKIFAPPARASA